MRIHFSTDDLPPRDREQFWLDFVAKHVVHVTPGDRADPHPISLAPAVTPI
jgi:hypothetical protein